MRIVLTGFMGAGKSTVGKALAKRLSMRFFDLDAVVEESVGLSVHEIFESRGEEEFRRLEREALERLLSSEEAVVAAGGGTFVEAAGRESVLGEALTVWLDAPLDLIEHRIRDKEAEKRPLYGTASAVRTLYEKRLPAYRQADIHVGIDSTDTPDRVAERIIESLPASADGEQLGGE